MGACGRGEEGVMIFSIFRNGDWGRARRGHDFLGVLIWGTHSSLVNQSYNKNFGFWMRAIVIYSK